MSALQMFRIPSLLVFAIFMVPGVSAGQSSALVSGPPHVIEGDLIGVGDKRFRLYAIDAPEKGQICEGKSRPYDCGRIATTGLMDLTAGVDQVTCYPKGVGRNGAIIALCKDPQGFDLSKQMLHTGWALALPDADNQFHRIQEKAQKAKRGLWKGQVTPPWRWQGNAAQIK